MAVPPMRTLEPTADSWSDGPPLWVSINDPEGSGRPWLLYLCSEASSHVLSPVQGAVLAHGGLGALHCLHQGTAQIQKGSLVSRLHYLDSFQISHKALGSKICAWGFLRLRASFYSLPKR